VDRAIGEAAYRAAVQAGGKNQKKLTVGWEVLGLEKDTATRIFGEEAEEGFKTYRETMYSGQTTKYDKKGNIIDKEGKLADPENAEPVDEEEGDVGTSVYECGNCGYTMFVAKGREFKFFGDDFTCPECGAAKDQFESRTIEEE
jgi:rubredoxin